MDRRAEKLSDRTYAIALKLNDNWKLAAEARREFAGRYGKPGLEAIVKAMAAESFDEYRAAVREFVRATNVRPEDAAEVAFELEEAKKARRMPEESIVELFHSGRQDIAKDYVLLNYGKYVYEVIHKTYPTYAQKYENELFQQGFIGMMRALVKYDPAKGKFTTFSKFYVMHEISDQIGFINNDSTVYFTAIQKRVKGAIEALKSQGFEPTVANIANYTDLKTDIVKRELDYINSTRFMYLDSDDAPEASSGYDESPEATMAKNERSKALLRSVEALPSPYRDIVLLKYDSSLTNLQIAQRLGLTVGKVKSGYQKGLRMMRQDVHLCEVYSEYISSAEQEMLKYSASAVRTKEQIDGDFDDLMRALDLTDEAARAKKETEAGILPSEIVRKFM